MNCTIPYNFRLISRNEGKIKSYESCLDVRAWNHDVFVRGGHLREWIRKDMPCCVLPVTTVAAALRIMGCRNRGRLTPRCHSNCKSKILLESVCASCHSIKECLKNYPKFDRYFDEEEFETSNWPCDRCLDALKGIKLLWKIILEKIFRVIIPKIEKNAFDDCSCDVLTTVKSWKTEILHETLYVKNMMPFLDDNEKVDIKTSCCQSQCDSEVTVTPHHSSAIPDDEILGEVSNEIKNSVLRTESYVVIPKATSRLVSRSISVRLKKVDVGCETCDLEEEENQVFRNNKINNMKQTINELMVDLERLKKENLALKMDLQCVCNENALKPYLQHRLASRPAQDTLAYLPKPFDDEQSPAFIDDVASEMIITMKNCTHTSYKQVSVLQVMHKSHKPFFSTNSKTDSSCKKEDPIHLLEKRNNNIYILDSDVHNRDFLTITSIQSVLVKTTFGNIVQREAHLVSNKCCENPPLDIKASYHTYKETVKKSRSKP